MQSYRFVYHKEGNTFEIRVFYPMCRKDKPLGRRLSEKEFKKFLSFMEYGGGYIQDELRFLDAGSREQLLSGICPACFASLDDEEAEAL